jgi:hypothetical protein
MNIIDEAKIRNQIRQAGYLVGLGEALPTPKLMALINEHRLQDEYNAGVERAANELLVLAIGRPEPKRPVTDGQIKKANSLPGRKKGWRL